MSDVAIRVEQLSKRYRIGRAQERHDTLRDVLVAAVRAPLARLRGDGRRRAGAQDTIWALQDVSFEVQRGEVLGIIGRNGAGKTTLLKILSRITEPTEGRAEIHGRVGSLLEVGTGFHPELTGRENVYLNGAILGMRRAEIDRKFDEIVAFAEIERFLDTPVKRYSSGMYVRLAFAVAAHLDPEILLVDEVLAVGDAEFQKKCLGKMGRVSRQGRTVLFVSHNLAAISRLCARGMVLEGGGLEFLGATADAVTRYRSLCLVRAGGHTPLELPPNVIFQASPAEPESDFAITRLELLDLADGPLTEVSTWDGLKIRIHYFARQRVRTASLELRISDERGTVLRLSTQPDGNVPMQIREGHGFGDCIIAELPLSAGRYDVGCGLAIPGRKWLVWHDILGTLTVRPSDVYGSGLAPIAARSLLAIRHRWVVD